MMYFKKIPKLSYKIILFSFVITTFVILILSSFFLIELENLSKKIFNTLNKGTVEHSRIYTNNSIHMSTQAKNQINYLIKDMNEGKNRFISFFIFLIVFLLSGIFLCIYFFTTKITYQLKKLENAANEIQKNNYDVEIKIDSNDEIAFLGNALIKMKNEIKNHIKEYSDINNKYRELALKYEEIISMISKLISMNETDEQAFLASLLDTAIKILPESDYGSISKITGNSWEFVAAIGHDINNLKTLNLKRDYMYNITKPVIVNNISEINNNLIPEDISLKFKKCTKEVKQNIFAPLKIKNELIGNISLDISANSDKVYTEDSLKAVTAIASIASSFMSFQKYVDIKNHFQNDIIISIIKILEIYDKYTEGHSKSVAEISRKILKEITDDELELQKIYWAGLVHDIGKILVPWNILNKTDKLTTKEYEEIKKHPLNGYEILINSEYLEEIAVIIKHHHERYDGKGYPDSLFGDNIPLYSRIISVADSYDAMISDRSYRTGIEKRDAVNQILKNSGSQFDPDIVDIFINLYYL